MWLPFVCFFFLLLLLVFLFLVSFYFFVSSVALNSCIIIATMYFAGDFLVRFLLFAFLAFFSPNVSPV